MVTILDTPFNPWQLMAEYEQQQSRAQRGAIGAAAIFVGTMRDFNQGSEVTAMRLEHYPGMAERLLTEAITAATVTHQLIEMRVVHRVGWIEPTEAIVLVAAWSAHRQAAFTACREVMELLKAQAPFWKQEQLQQGGTRWVAA